MGILSIGMQYLACVIPLITAFPLIFALQIVEDTWSWRSLVAFWLLPQLWILAQRSRCTDGKPDLSVFAYRDVLFYFIWLSIYITMFLWFLQIQFDLMKSNLWVYVQEMDWALASSWMHVDFCVMNVLITDHLHSFF